jgi:uncharacterized protein
MRRRESINYDCYRIYDSIRLAMYFEWDDVKNSANHRKHGIWFEEAQTVWTDRNSVEFFDPEHSKTEDRFIRIGYSTAERLMLVIFCERESSHKIRIISARKATNSEREQYETGI